MTQDDVAKDVGNAVIERRALIQKIKCLELRLKTTGDALVVVSGNPVNEAANAALDAADDPLAEWAELKAARERLAVLKEVIGE